MQFLVKIKSQGLFLSLTTLTKYKDLSTGYIGEESATQLLDSRFAKDSKTEIWANLKILEKIWNT